MSERGLHLYAADLLRLKARRDILWLHIANEGERSPRTGAFFKRMGMRPGAADFLIVVKGQAHWLELKAAKGRQSPAQRDFEADAVKSGSPYVVCRSPEAVNTILDMWGALIVDSASLRRVA